MEKSFTGLALNNSGTSTPGQVLIGNGYIYVMSGSVSGPISIQISTGQISSQPGANYSSGGIYDGAAEAVYFTQDGVSPESLYRTDASAGPLGNGTQFNYFATFAICGTFWLSNDESTIFTGCGTTFSASSDPKKDMLYTGSLPGVNQVQALAAAATGQIAAIPKVVLYGGTPVNADAVVDIFDSKLTQTGLLAIPPYVTTQASNLVHGRWVFFKSDSSALYIVSQVDTTAALQNNFVLDTIPLAASGNCGTRLVSQTATAPSSGGYATISVTLGNDCVYTATSSVPWIVVPTYPLASGNQTLTYLVRGNTATSARTGSITIGSQVFTVTQGAAAAAGTFNPLSFNPLTAEYSKGLDRMILVSSAPNELHVYDPTTQADQTVALPSAPLSLSVAPDGKSALVGHDGSTSAIDLQGLTVTKTVPVDGVLSTVALGNNGYAYADDANGTDWYFPRLFSIDLTAATETVATSGYSASGNLRVDAGLNLLYTGTQNVFDISNGVPALASSAGGGSVFGTAVWLSDDGSLLINNAGGVYYTSDVPAQDLESDGALSGTDSVIWPAASSVQKSIAVIPLINSDDTQLQIYAENGLQLQQQETLPQFVLNSTSTPSHGKYVFWNAAEDKLFVIAQADSSAGLSSSFAEITVESPASIPPCSIAVSPQSAYVASAGGNVIVSVTTPCSWNITSPFGNDWLFVTPFPGEQLGSQYVTVSVTPNVSTANPPTATTARSATFSVAGQPVTITQAGSSCSYSLSAPQAQFTANGGTASVVLTAGTGCQWTAEADSPWVTVIGNTSGSGSATIQYSVAGDSETQPRTGTLYIAGLGLVINEQNSPATPLDFVPVAPCRVLDTRLPAGPLGGPFISGGASRSFNIPSSQCNIPANAGAYSFNVTVVPHGPLGYITIWPTGQAEPVVSTMNSLDGRIKADAAIVPAGTNGAISVSVTNDADVVVDINGYFVPSPSVNGLEFFPLAPCRIADTRKPDGALGGPIPQAGLSRDFPVQQSNCGMASDAQAYSLNFTAVPQDGPLGYLTVWPSGQQQPFVSTLNAFTGTITANAAIVPAGNNGDISTYVTNNSHLVIDVNGYFASPASGGLHFYAVSPCRAFDSRYNSTKSFSGVISIDLIFGTCQLPSTAQAVVVNATVVPAAVLSYLTLWPDGEEQPFVSTLNAFDGAITSNMAIVPVSNRAIDAFATDKTDLILDVTGYFAP